MTNGERIRSMTDEELADILPSGDCFCCPIITDSTHPTYVSCEECALAWLKDENVDDEVEERIIAPIDFEKHMKAIVDMYKDDEERSHMFMINVLRSLDSGAGCDIFDCAQKWYA